MTDNPSTERLADILARAQTIAVVGLSDNPGRESHRVAAYLQSAGYRIIPVNPNVSSVLGERARAALTELDESVDIVDVFRRTEAIPAVGEDALRMEHLPAVFWMQEGLSHPECAARLDSAGITVVQALCIATTHRWLLASRKGR